ncbi:MAG: hypothetical protein LBU85_13050 [Treponema sp.]|jgi:hypothetical protein|nr:hypothetical protein [Treponema sp.]
MGLFSFFHAGMDINNNKIILLDSNCNKTEYKYDIDTSLDLLDRIKELITLTIKEIPFSLIRSKLLFSTSGNENSETISRAQKIIYRNSKNKIREIVWIDYGLLIISVYNKLNKCIYLVHINNQIYGFAGFFGSMITKEILFEDNVSLDRMIDQIKNEMPNNIPENIIKLGQNHKELNLEELWNNEEIIISLEPEFFYNKTKNIQNDIFKNNYISNIADIGMDECMRKVFNIKHKDG